MTDLPVLRRRLDEQAALAAAALAEEHIDADIRARFGHDPGGRVTLTLVVDDDADLDRASQVVCAMLDRMDAPPAPWRTFERCIPDSAVFPGQPLATEMVREWEWTA